MKKFKALKLLCIFALALFMPFVMQGCNKEPELQLESNVWYISAERASDYEDRNYFAKFDLENNKFGMNTAAIEDMPDYLDTNGVVWVDFTKSTDDGKIVLSIDVTDGSVRTKISITNISNNTFTLTMTEGNGPAVTYTFLEYVDVTLN